MANFNFIVDSYVASKDDDTDRVKKIIATKIGLKMLELNLIRFDNQLSGESLIFFGAAAVEDPGNG